VSSKGSESPRTGSDDRSKDGRKVPISMDDLLDEFGKPKRITKEYIQAAKKVPTNGMKIIMYTLLISFLLSLLIRHYVSGGSIYSREFDFSDLSAIITILSLIGLGMVALALLDFSRWFYLPNYGIILFVICTYNSMTLYLNYRAPSIRLYDQIHFLTIMPILIIINIIVLSILFQFISLRHYLIFKRNNNGAYL